MAEGQGAAGCSGETAESSSVLLVTGQYATSEDCSSPVSRQVAQTLRGAGWKVYSTVLEDTEEDRKCAEADGVELILPTRSQGDTREPCLDWLTFDHVDRYPNDRLPQDVGWIVGHAGVTSRAAATIKEQRFPQASLSLVTQAIPEDTEKYKEDEKAMGIGEKEDSIRQDAEKADTVFSVGHRTQDHFVNSFCAIPKDKRPIHYLFLPKPSDLFLNTTVEYFETSEKVVLLFGRVTTVERVKGFDLAAKILSKAVERSQNRIKLRIRGVSKEEYQASMSILQTSINSGKLIPTLLPHGTQEDVCRDMQQAHLVLMPSRAEPFGLVGLEAMAAGVPVLVSDQSGLADLVNKVVPEFRHSVLRITGDDSVDVGRWADQIVDVLRMSEAEFRRAAELKQKLLESKYWEESHQQFLQAFGGAEVPVPVGAAGAEPSKVTGVNQTDLFQKSVKKYYELKLTHFKPLIWNDNFTLSLSNVFTQLELIQKSTGRQRTELKSLDDLFKPDVTGLSTAPRCILIEGEAGGGKTTFLSKEALDAVSQKTELGRRHDIVLLIRLREVRKRETIEEMVWDQCVPETTEGIDVQSIRTILQRNESCVLFLLDGYDELRPKARAAGQAIPKLLSGKLYPNSTIVITSRPSAGVQQYTRPDCHVHNMGFSPKHVEKYMQQYFTVVGKQELTKTLTLHVKGNQLLNALIYTPMFLMFVCLLWEENQEMVSTGTMMGLYDNLLTCLVRKCCKREGVDMPTEGLPTEVAESLLQLGKLALRALLRNETLLDLTEVKREKVNWELLLKLGVVSLEVSSSKPHPTKQLNFSHKTMQEFLAGRYVAHAQVNQDFVELLQLTSISKSLELSNLLQFTCGCDSRAAQAVMEELSKLSSREFTHLQPEQFKMSKQPILRDIPMDRDVQKSCQTYERFAHLCLNILSERQEPEVLQGISQALPIVMLDSSSNSREATGLKYYIQNLHSANLPDRLRLKIHGDSRDTVQYLQQCFTTSLPGLKLDLTLPEWEHFDSPDLTARLVSVLKNVPCLRALDLSHTNLTPSSLQPLVQGFRHMSLLEELDLSWKPDLGDAGMEVLQVGLFSVPHLAVLRLIKIKMTAVGMSSLAPYMRHLVGLRELDIHDDMIGDTGLESLTTVLHTFTAMQVLGLGSTGISPTGMRTLVPVLCKLTRLIKLDISGNAIGDPELECLAAILHHLTAMKVLDLRRTGISDRGISSLIKALPHLVQLQVLNVSFNNIGDSGIVSLVQTLCQPSSLDMEQNPPGDKSLTTAPHYNTTLQELDIRGNRGVTGAGLGRVAQLISTLPALTWLRMSGHSWDTPAHLSDTAAMDLAEALPRLPALEQLDLLYISMEPAGFQAVVQAAEEHPTLERLWYMSLVPEGADTTASCLRLTPL
ncbi:hypothetical protein Bbelb_097410 [Branchiostoma belcheri]|nr:hypothetical protein Bbelb_097410 [Branchiostoma belcheri]